MSWIKQQNEKHFIVLSPVFNNPVIFSVNTSIPDNYDGVIQLINSSLTVSFIVDTLTEETTTLDSQLGYRQWAYIAVLDSNLESGTMHTIILNAFHIGIIFRCRLQL